MSMTSNRERFAAERARGEAALEIAKAEFPEDRFGYALRLAELLCTSPDILVEGGADVPHDYGDEAPKRYDAEDVFSPLELEILKRMKAHYGDAFRASVYRGSGDCAYKEVWCFHDDFMPRHKYMQMILSWLQYDDRDISIVQSRGIGQLMGLCNDLSLVQRLRYADKPHLDALVNSLIHPAVDAAGTRHIPVFPAIRGGSYKSCPTFGTPRHIGSPDQLHQDGIVVKLGKHRYRIWLDWPKMAEEGYLATPPCGEKLLRIQQTKDRITPIDPLKKPFNWLTVRGKGRSQQEDAAASFLGQRPICLCNFECGDDATWNVMVNLDTLGEIYVAWLEVSST